MANKRVFICSPFRGATPQEQQENVAQAQRFLRYAVRQYCAPFAPHLLYPGALNDAIESERNQGIQAGLSFLSTCGQLWYLNTSDDPHARVPRITSGMRKELEMADLLGLDIYRYDFGDTDDDFEQANVYSLGGGKDHTWKIQ